MRGRRVGLRPSEEHGQLQNCFVRLEPVHVSHQSQGAEDRGLPQLAGLTQGMVKNLTIDMLRKGFHKVTDSGVNLASLKSKPGMFWAAVLDDKTDW